MAVDEQEEIRRLRRQLREVTAERDRLLVENSRLLSGSEHLQKLIPASQKEFASTTSGIPINTEMR